MTTYIIIGVVALLIIYIIATYNKLVVVRNRVRDAWAQIDVQLKRRFDLIPNLVETVKGYATHERETLESVTAARTRYMSSATPEQQMESNNMLSQALTHLFAVAEQYPDLKANQNFMNLQQELSNTEDKISYARQFYNDTVLKFNNKVEMFPSNIIAGMFGFKLAAFFRAEEQAYQAPQIKF